MGPPYKDMEKKPLNFTVPTLKAVLEASLLKPGGIIISQRQAKEPLEIPQGLESYRVEKYGDTVVTFIKAAAGSN